MSACSFGMCAVATCEKCKPKLLTCPSCGKRTYIANVCVFCKSAIPQECQDAAVEAWKRKHLEEMEREKQAQHSRHEEKETSHDQ